MTAADGVALAVVVARAGSPVAILTRSDLLEFLAAQRTKIEA